MVNDWNQQGGGVPEKYAMDEGERPDDVRRRNRITGIVLLLIVGIIIGITVWSRSSGTPAGYNEVGEPAGGLGEPHQKKPAGAPRKER